MQRQAYRQQHGFNGISLLPGDCSPRGPRLTELREQRRVSVQVMKVLMATDGLWNGGLERQLTLLASSLPEPWHASVLSMEDGPYRTVLERSGVELRLAPRRGEARLAPCCERRPSAGRSP